MSPPTSSGGQLRDPAMQRGYLTPSAGGTSLKSTIAGTTIADLATRSIGIGYPGSSLLLFALVLASLWIWYRAMGSINVADIPALRAGFFLGDDHFVADLGHCAGRLACRWPAKLSCRCRRVWISTGCSGSALLADHDQQGGAVLSGLHPHTPAWRDRGRLSRQAGCKWRS
jgi:hypothetical protein